MQSIAKGVYPTMITPYLSSGDIDYAAATQMAKWYAKMGADGIFAVCQSSEMFFLSLDERVNLAKVVVAAAGDTIDVIVSGHISDAIDDQIAELTAMSKTGAKAIVMVTNRLAAEDESDEIWIANAERILRALPDVVFGLYECPHPYKRLMSEKLTRWCAASGRFAFLKDTCCDARQIREKLAWIGDAAQSSGVQPMGLYNANTATLLESLRDGAAGFSGVMGNLHPDLYAWLYCNFDAQPVLAEKIAALLTLLSSLERECYPICAKQHMLDEGIEMTIASRSVDASNFSYMNRLFLSEARIVEQIARDMIGQTTR